MAPALRRGLGGSLGLALALALGPSASAEDSAVRLYTNADLDQRGAPKENGQGRITLAVIGKA